MNRKFYSQSVVDEDFIYYSGGGGRGFPRVKKVNLQDLNKNKPEKGKDHVTDFMIFFRFRMDHCHRDQPFLKFNTLR